MESSLIDPYIRYARLNDLEMAALRDLRPLVAANAQGFVDGFYAHLQTFEVTRPFFRDPAVLQRLLQAQRRYLLTLFDAVYNDTYFEQRRAIGQTHFRIGLGFQWYIGAYAYYLEYLLPMIREHYQQEPARATLAQTAVVKATMMDMSIVLEAYHEGDMAALAESRAQVLHQEKLAAIGLLASGLAHEIGNPLSSIMAVCENQLRKNPEPQVADRFQRIRDQVVRINTIVRRLVNYARPAQNRWAQVNLGVVIESALAVAQLSRAAKTVSTEIQIPADLPTVRGMEDQLAQVFVNLFANAIDAMRENSGQLKIQASVSGNATVRIVIIDNGCGINEKDLPKLFTPFYTTKEPGKGTGLGLHVSDGIIKQHDGKILVSSNVGVGTTFTVELPIAGPDGSMQT